MEYLTFNSGSQWSLHKALQPEGQSSPRSEGLYPDADYKVYRNVTGQLHEDHGQKGSVHGNPGNKRAPKQGQARRNWGKPATAVRSLAADINPGLGTD